MIFKRIGREILAAVVVSLLTHNGVLVSYDVASRCDRAGAVTNVSSPTDMQAVTLLGSYGFSMPSALGVPR